MMQKVNPDKGEEYIPNQSVYSLSAIGLARLYYFVIYIAHQYQYMILSEIVSAAQSLCRPGLTQVIAGKLANCRLACTPDSGSGLWFS